MSRSSEVRAVDGTITERVYLAHAVMQPAGRAVPVAVCGCVTLVPLQFQIQRGVPFMFSIIANQNTYMGQ